MFEVLVGLLDICDCEQENRLKVKENHLIPSYYSVYKERYR